MQYRNLGNSGLKISELSFGSWVTFVNQLNEKNDLKILGFCEVMKFLPLYKSLEPKVLRMVCEKGL